MHANLPFCVCVCVCLCAERKCGCVLTPSCSSFTRTGVIFSRKSQYKVSGHCQSRCKELSSCALLCESLFCCNLLPSRPFFSLLSSLEVESGLIQTVTGHWRSLTFLNGRHVPEHFTLSPAQEDTGLLTQHMPLNNSWKFISWFQNWSFMVYEAFHRKGKKNYSNPLWGVGGERGCSHMTANLRSYIWTEYRWWLKAAADEIHRIILRAELFSWYVRLISIAQNIVKEKYREKPLMLLII